MNSQSLDTERAWLEQIETSKLVGICLLDVEGRLVQRIDDDPRLRSAMADYQAERIRELVLAEKAPLRQPVNYPLPQ